MTKQKSVPHTTAYSGLNGMVTSQEGITKQIGSWKILQIREFLVPEILGQSKPELVLGWQNWHLIIEGYEIDAENPHIEINLDDVEGRTFSGKAVGTGPDFVGYGDLEIT